ncbi:ribosomal protein L11 methyltransferase [Ligilactobacillus sp. WC1T17]|uniref:Ribosomal protein L11 methyltransferase n=1 Tax=Ligilactobacillus ruminis TaxID=1623 RepID=A0ABY1ABI9_9LACO|nr:ribosomal protein L11 methyltransferase [Ligilactobacillus ruminis]
MEWTELTVETTLEASDAVINLLMENGAGGVQIDDKAGDDDVKIITYFPAKVALAELAQDLQQKVQLLRQFNLNPGKAKVYLTKEDDQSWVDVWKKYYHPVRVTRYLTIVPSWEDYEPKQAGELIMRLDPGKAFGTGTHPTTRLALAALETSIRGGETLIDVGTGSGVLSIAACLLGAKKASAYDVDDEAIKACKVNLDLNPAVKKQIDVGVNDLLKGIDTKVDLICANILAEIIVPLIPQAYACLNEGGIFITSGIIRDKVEVIKEQLQAQGFAIDQILQMKDWFSIIAHKAKAGE